VTLPTRNDDGWIVTWIIRGRGRLVVPMTVPIELWAAGWGEQGIGLSGLGLEWPRSIAGGKQGDATAEDAAEQTWRRSMIQSSKRCSWHAQLRAGRLAGANTAPTLAGTGKR
jgi:hypothetical protein